ncbi:hypothetical protein QBC46DRAFT_345737 [Diplogelasinospora grovesii]|uniref:AMP-dependent synthetase/ligase domain-containing protein n=1 Tax=Diplogelasinospora grovesii TaxID=303347 RepID=A0AAN6MZC1_9PEZI|nr:hypothetical protein QBC46DRAFT_345737 [Diplogelasinospora grovesii]
MVEHVNLAALVRASADVFESGFGARVLQLASFSFDASILEWTTALCTGACLCFAQHPRQLVGEYLTDAIDTNRISFMQITPTARDTRLLRQARSHGTELHHAREWSTHVPYQRPRLLLENGSLVVLGRLDRELKIRGFRIAPEEEVEKAILDACAGVTEGSVQPSENGLEMWAFVTPETISSQALGVEVQDLNADLKKVYGLDSKSYVGLLGLLGLLGLAAITTPWSSGGVSLPGHS